MSMKFDNTEYKFGIIEYPSLFEAVFNDIMNPAYKEVKFMIKNKSRASGPGGSVKYRRRVFVLLILFLICFFVSFAIGLYGVPVPEVIKIFISKIFPIEHTWDPSMEIVVMNVRFPRIIAAGLIGGALAVSGGVYQGMFKNPMVSPDVLGSSAGAGFGAALGILLGVGYAGISFLSFGFGLLAVAVVCVISSKHKNNMAMGLILAGIMMGSLFSAGTSFLKLAADPTDQLPAITYWLMGSLASIRKEDLMFLVPVILLGMIPLFLLRWRLNVATLSDDEAMALGVNIHRLRMGIIVCATLMTAVSVSVSGMIGWVGFVIPHFARKFAGNDYKYLLPATILMGGAFLMLVDNLARTLSTSEVPIGILTAFVGAPFFLYLLLKGGQNHA